MSKIIDAFEKFKKRTYTPKFKKGDIIFNKKFKTIAKIKEVIKESQSFNSAYKMIYIKNDLKFEKNMKYYVTRNCTNIDYAYKKINAKNALILYGVKE